MSRQTPTTAFTKSKTLDNKYMLGDEIGKGAYGRVYKGLDLENGDFVAIKQVSLENIAQEDLNIIMQEIDLLKNLNHKNIVKYLGSLKTKSHLHIILEYVENGSLANIIKPNKFGPFPESLVAVYIAQVLEGLVYLHEQGVIHRDIKGANILTTKEGLVKLADFGVATKLTEADVNTHSVVGTPYWMAPEVIEMSGVCAASDIWSVGCTVIELLTCIPPYYDLQPMPALFRIVQDEHPPIPDSLSPDITGFLHQCFKKDARQRPDAKTLLSHPWIQNCRRVLQSSLRHSGTLKNIEEDDSADAEVSGGDNKSAGESSFVEKEDSAKEFSNVVADGSKSQEDNASDSNLTLKGGDVPSDKVPTLAIHEKSFLKTGSSKFSSNREVLSSEPTGDHEISNAKDLHEITMNGEVGSLQLRGVAKNLEGKDSCINDSNKSFAFGPRGQDNGSIKAVKIPPAVEGNELSRFSDPPGDAYLDDLFHPLDKQPGEFLAEASTSSSTSHMVKGNTSMNDGGKNDLAKELRATIARKQWEKESEIGQANSGGNLLHRVMIGVLKDDVIDIDGLVFDEKLPGENLFPLQAVEFGKLVGSLKPEESEDVVVSACQKLIGIFHQRPEQKIVFVTQHGLLPLTDLLEVPKARVICSVLQLINQIIKDNTDFQENACLVGLIPAVMSFAVPDRPREIRMEAAYFLQQLCQSSSLTLQMFIACRGIPVLIGFLEADYAKYREMVHLAIDGMWQVFKLQQSTPRNDFCRIAAKNGILLRLINTLYSLNEATRLASMSVGGGFLVDGSTQRPRSGILDPKHPFIVQNEALLSALDQQGLHKVRRGLLDHQLEPSHASTSNPRRSDANHPVDADRPRSSNATAEVPAVEKISNLASRESSVGAFKERDTVDRWKTDPSRADIEPRLQRISISASRKSTDRPPKLTEPGSNGLSVTGATQQDQVRPLLSLLDKEPPSGRFSGQIEYVRQFSGLERHESVLPLLHASEKKTNGELDFLMAEFADVSQRGRENGNPDSSARVSHKVAPKKLGTDGAASTSGIVSQTASGVLSGSGVLNARPGSATSSGLLSHMVSSLNADVAREYLEKVADLLLEFAQADTTVKSYMCSQSLLSRLFQMFNRVEPPILLKILKCINHLSTDPNCLENLQRAEAIKYLIPNLELKEGSLVSEIHHEVLNALFNLCKINKRRQEQAAENGIIPHLMQFITSNSNLKQYALPLLCDMAHASRNSREQLRAHGGLDVYLNLLEDQIWSVTALDSIAVCLAHDNDNKKVEQALLKKDAVQKLVNFFQCCPEQHFVHILEPFLKIITKSARINTTLAVNGLTPLLIARLDHQDAIARLNLLRLIKAVYEHHPQPKKLIVENDLPEKLQNLIGERRDGQVLVKQMATSLLKALHINTVL
ncbi:PREDICTED: MAP3K epsilon protein kinase 1-like isoform X2 [Lupinus angustifolius]|uniref:MAP3K epsilon protein kinase 1-like isoform X1 n=2 Tax=Lupinus angustifolius TaxID=3871 RepID=UPI00092E95B7|nr:PREDICTED: MAP3K epsilon protein kinase 1-like isoform X1 [Lupinus angustifolius]XP_019450938.1 PREDICTED: MAP3K epsilon protein kinase 1-like isoform X2 [Lupinus angustifolius]